MKSKAFVLKPLCPAEAGHLPQGGENTVVFSWITIKYRGLFPLSGGIKGGFYH